jgi:hypothetical protein
MNNYLILLILMLPIPLEIIFDLNMWKDGLNDKPISTILRVISFVGFSFVATAYLQGLSMDWTTLAYLITGGLAGFGLHFLLFNYALNVARPDKKISYRKEGELLTPLFWVYELALRLFTSWVTVLSFFKWEWIAVGVPQGTKFYEYFIL